MNDLVQIGARIDRKLWTSLKIRALQEGVTATHLVEMAVRDFMQEPKPAAKAADLSSVDLVVLENDQLSGKQLADLLNEQGFTTSTGQAWGANTVSKLRAKLKKQGGKV